MKNIQRRSWIAVLLCIVVKYALEAQRTPYIQAFPYSWPFVNPAMVEPGLFAGRAEDRPQAMASLGSRQQWIGTEEALMTVFGTFEWSPKDQQDYRYRMGARLLYDKAGAFTTSSCHFNYTYFLPFRNHRYLHIALAPGIVGTSINSANLRWADPNDPKINDLPTGKILFDADFGLTYRFAFGPDADSPEELNYGYIGMAVLGFPQIRSFLETPMPDVNKISQVNFLAGAHIIPSERDHFCKWEPFVWIRVNPASAQPLPVSIDANLRCYVRKTPLWFGGGYGTNRLLRAEAGWQGLPRLDEKKKLRAGLLWSMPLFSPNFNPGQSFELTLSYVLR
jgi:type IX secretion system PorP/SprF family membrane protein